MISPAERRYGQADTARAERGREPVVADPLTDGASRCPLEAEPSSATAAEGPTIILMPHVSAADSRLGL